MGIEKFIQKVCVQTCVYWANPVNDGYGGFTFDDPVEISCRWEDKNQICIGDDGQEVTSDSEVLVTQDLDKNGYLCLCTLDDIDDDDLNSPMNVSGASQIISISKIPMIKSTTEFVRQVYLRRKWYVARS